MSFFECLSSSLDGPPNVQERASLLDDLSHASSSPFHHPRVVSTLVHLLGSPLPVFKRAPKCKHEEKEDQVEEGEEDPEGEKVKGVEDKVDKKIAGNQAAGFFDRYPSVARRNENS